MAFHDSHLKMVLLENISANPRSTMLEISTWLGLGSGWLDALALSPQNETVAASDRFFDSVLRSLLKRSPWSRGRDFAFLRRNDAPAPPPTEDDLRALEDLRKWYVPWNEKLQEDTSLDLTTWKQASDWRSGT